jgi:hypothetical protein
VRQLTTEATLLHAAKGHPWIAGGVAVDEHAAGVQFAGQQAGFVENDGVSRACWRFVIRWWLLDIVFFLGSATPREGDDFSSGSLLVNIHGWRRRRPKLNEKPFSLCVNRIGSVERMRESPTLS